MKNPDEKVNIECKKASVYFSGKRLLTVMYVNNRP